MNVLEKILEEIGATDRIRFSSYTELLIAVKDVEKIIRSHMDEAKDANAPSNDGWISVNERLPEKTDYYLVQLSRKLPNEDYSDRVVVLFNGEEKEFECYANLIIAWRPLPKTLSGTRPRRTTTKTSVSNKPKEAKMIAQILKTRAPFCTKANRYSAISTAING